MLQFDVIKSIMAGLAQLPRAAVIALSIALLLIVSGVDYTTHTTLSLLMFYLLPIAIATWFVEVRAGFLMALLSAGVVSWLQMQNSLDPKLFPSVWNGAMVGVLGIVMADLLQNVKVSSELEGQLRRIDASTGAINRLFFLELLEAEFHRAERYSFAITLAYIHIHNLNQLQERLGHQATDELLYQFVEQLSQALRANDVVARLENCEFAVLLPQTNDTQAQQVFTRIQPQVKEVLVKEANPLEYSIGVLTFLQMPEAPEAMMAQAEQWLKYAKSRDENYIDYQVFP
jgi:diguanylate cyclase (GGDEF)-like protein